MNADLYICDKSFIHNGIDADNDVYKKIFSLKNLVDKVSKEYPTENAFYFKSDSFLKTPLFSDGTTVEDLITQKVKKNSECQYLFNTIFKYFRKCNLDTDGLKEYLSPDLEDENNCNGLIVLNIIPELPRNTQILSDFAGWLRFRRFFLGKYPQSPAYFIEESQKYFKELILHDDNHSTLKKVIDSHSNQIVIYLGCLNDSLVSELEANDVEKDFAVFLKKFAIKYNLDGASFEGSKNDVFNFTFTDKQGHELKAYCEPHLKMQKDDSGNTRKYCRIYFRKPNKNEKLIYIGYIGVHIKKKN
ncbi:MAG: hypothetical protein ACK5KT_16540 [Dysgonomonas sp.]